MNFYGWEKVYDNFRLDIAIDPWSKHHSDEKRLIPRVKGYQSLFPLINKSVNSFPSQHHCMEITIKTMSFLNPGQTPIDVCDQPVFALTKEIQIRNQSKFGIDKYFSLMGGLHIELCMLSIHGELINGSGLYEILAQSQMSIIGTQAVLSASHIKQARYCLQVASSAIYIKLREAHKNSTSTLALMEWQSEKSKSSQMCYYCNMILNIQL